jgi:RimJ/RimL family protein N-acetyltransferase
MFSGEAKITARPLTARDWRIFRDMRILALESEPGVFFAPLSSALSKSPEEWQSLVSSPTQQAFGIFDRGRLVGITAVFTSRDDPSGSTAGLAMSFIMPKYRGRGLAKLLFDVRLDWVRARPHFKRVLVSHRESNEASRRANQRQGFLFRRRVNRTWPDGEVEDELIYELSIGEDDG